MKIMIFALVVNFFNVKCLQVCDYEKNIIFTVYNSSSPKEKFVSNFSSDIDEHCDANGKFAIVVHGWLDTVNWVPEMIKNLIKYRGGCVLFMDYKYFSNKNYLSLRFHFQGIAEVLLKKIKQIGKYDELFLFGFSFGARLCQEAGSMLGNQIIDRMDLCEPASPLFDNAKDPKTTAKNVACINTSAFEGTTTYNCHQNFIMGNCGMFQPGSTLFLNGHTLCPYYYNIAFNHDFVPNNLHNCQSDRLIRNVGKDVKMGYNADFDREANRGDIFIATTKNYPYLVEKSQK